MRLPCFDNPRRALTLVELLVVIAIIGTLVALLLPAVQAAREAARRNSCQNNLKQIGLSLHSHVDARQVYPMGRTRTDGRAVSWAFLLLPFMEGDAIFRSLQPALPVSADANAQAMRTPIPTFACPSRRTAEADRDFDNGGTPPKVRGVAALGDYAGCAGTNYLGGMNSKGQPDDPPDPSDRGVLFSYSRVRQREVTDGLSNTLVAGDKHKPILPNLEDAAMLQYQQGDTAFLAGDQPYTPFGETAKGLAQDAEDPSPVKFGSEHPGIVQFTFLDGHVKAISSALEAKILTMLGCIGDDNVVPAEALN